MVRGLHRVWVPGLGLALGLALAGSCGDADEAAEGSTGSSGTSSTDTSANDAASSTDTTTGPVVDCPIDGDLGPGMHTVQLQHEGIVRDALVFVPAAYDPEAATPLVLNMHGLTSTPESQIEFSAMNPVADVEGFVVAYPRGTDNSWNAGTCCGEAATNDVDDVGFLRAVVEEVSATLCIDPGRVYATGMSNGGHMSHRLGCEAADLFAAIAPVDGAMRALGCDPSRPIPVIAFHGTDDPIVSYADGRAGVEQWITLDGCGPDPAQTEMFGTSRCEIWRDCTDGVEVQLCTLEGMGHCWPGGSEQLCIGILGGYSDEIDANTRMWSVLSQYRLP